MGIEIATLRQLAALQGFEGLPPLAGGAPSPNVGAGGSSGPTQGGDLPGFKPSTATGKPAIGETIPAFLEWNGSEWVWAIGSATAPGGAPTGAAGGVLSGTYPNPGLAANAVKTAAIEAGAVSTAKLGAGATGWLIATQVAGVDPTGATDSTAGLQLWAEECQIKTVGGFCARGKYKIGEAKKPLDLSKVAETELKRVKQYELYFDAGAVLEGNALLVKEPVVLLSQPAEKAYQESRFKFGKIKTGHKESDCLKVAAISDSYLEVNTVEGLGGAERGEMAGVRFVPGAATPQFIGNNEIHVGLTVNCGFGIVTEGNAFAEPNIQFSGNLVFLGEVDLSLHDGIVVDKNGVGNNTEWNSFFIGDVEGGGAAGIRAYNGNNTFVCGSENANKAKEGFVLQPEAVSKGHFKGLPYVRGRFLSGVTLNEQACDLVNALNPLGEIARPTGLPENPVSGTAYRPAIERPCKITFVANEAGGIIESVNVEGKIQLTGVTANQCASVRIAPGQSVSCKISKGPIGWLFFSET